MVESTKTIWIANCVLTDREDLLGSAWGIGTEIPRQRLPWWIFISMNTHYGKWMARIGVN